MGKWSLTGGFRGLDTESHRKSLDCTLHSQKSGTRLSRHTEEVHVLA